MEAIIAIVIAAFHWLDAVLIAFSEASPLWFIGLGWIILHRIEQMESNIKAELREMEEARLSARFGS